MNVPNLSINPFVDGLSLELSCISDSRDWLIYDLSLIAFLDSFLMYWIVYSSISTLLFAEEDKGNSACLSGMLNKTSTNLCREDL